MKNYLLILLTMNSISIFCTDTKDKLAPFYQDYLAINQNRIQQINASTSLPRGIPELIASFIRVYDSRDGWEKKGKELLDCLTGIECQHSIGYLGRKYNDGDGIKRIKELLDSSADPNFRGETGTPFLSTVIGSLFLSLEIKEKIVSILLNEPDIDIDATQPHQENSWCNWYGDHEYTPLMWAVVNGLQNIVLLLLQHGADANIRNEMNLTALGEAKSRNRQEIANLLVKYGAVE